MATPQPDPSSDHIDSLPLVDLRLLSQSELYSLSLSGATHRHRRGNDDDSVIPKIDRSNFNESAGSRKQTYSKLRLKKRKPNSPPAAASSSLHIPLHIPEPEDQENSQIITLLQELFGVESLRNAPRLNRNDAEEHRLVPVQVEFKQPSPLSTSFPNVPIGFVDGSQTKRKRGRPRKHENNSVTVIVEEPKKVKADGDGERKAMAAINEKGSMVDDVGLDGDPFEEELKRRTQGLETEPQILEFLEALNGEWASQRKKRRIVSASDLGDLLPAGWKIVITVMRRAGRASALCRRYVRSCGTLLLLQGQLFLAGAMLFVAKTAAGVGKTLPTTVLTSGRFYAMPCLVLFHIWPAFPLVSSADVHFKATVSSLAVALAISFTGFFYYLTLLTYPNAHVFVQCPAFACSLPDFASTLKICPKSTSRYDVDMVDSARKIGLNYSKRDHVLAPSNGELPEPLCGFVPCCPGGRQFESCKEASAYVLSASGVQDRNQLKPSFTDDAQQLSSSMNMASVSCVGHVPTGDMKTDASANYLSLAGASIHASHEKILPISSSIGSENFNSDLALSCKLGDATGGSFRDFDHQTEDRQLLKADKNGNSIQGSSFVEDRVCNVRSEKLVGANESNDAACNLYIPLVFSTPVSNNNSDNGQFSDEINAATCVKGGISNIANQDRYTGCYETVPCGNEPACVDKDGSGLSVKLVEENIQKITFESSTLAPNSEVKIFGGENLEDRHLISSLGGMEIRDGSINNDKQPIISSRDQAEIIDVSANVKQQASISNMDRAQTSELKDSDENIFDSDLFNSSISERTCVHSGYINNVSFSSCTQDASEYGGFDFASDLKLAKDVSDNNILSNEEAVTRCLQERSCLNDQNSMMDDNLFALTGNQPSAFHDNLNISDGTFDALNAVDAGCLEPQLGIVSCSNIAVDTYTAASIMQGNSQGCVSIPLGGSILNFENQNDDGVNRTNESCVPEKAQNAVEIFQTDSMGNNFLIKCVSSSAKCTGNHKALLVYSQFPMKMISKKSVSDFSSILGLIDSADCDGGFSVPEEMDWRVYGFLKVRGEDIVESKLAIADGKGGGGRFPLSFKPYLGAMEAFFFLVRHNVTSEVHVSGHKSLD
ncbi:hypothetical protein VNO78_01355 [Psophocarpus tetragonolobus]|uniref:Uncharacterized protein n=1 Tax=Psophocarpus tetragonolobus TaxID=3891 RepID=A0AAN9XVH7_PSOTE